MKLATLRDGSRDGILIVVSQDLQRAVKISHIAQTLQLAIDNWSTVSYQLQEIYTALNQDQVADSFVFNVQEVMAPLPRAYQWADGSAYVNHVALVRKARGASMPDSFWSDPLMYQGGSDHFLAATDPIQLADDSWGIDFEAEVTVITDDVPMGITPEKARDHIKLIMLVNDVSLRNLIPQELAKGFGFFQSKPSSSFSPVAITPDELGQAWQDAKVHLPLISTLNKKIFGQPEAGDDMTFDFGTLIAHAAKTRPLTAGTIIGSGTVSNNTRSKGSSCIAEQRMLEKIEQGEPQTPFMTFGDTIRIEMFDKNNKSIFGAIQNTVEKYIPKG